MAGGGIRVSASILTADFGNLSRVVRKLERAGVDRLHLDVMDGHFVPNLTFGADVVASIRRLTRLPLDVHLMIAEPARYLDRFIAAGSDSITFHVEVAEPPQVKVDALTRVGEARISAGLAVSPATPVSALEPYLEQLSAIMVMGVEPGWGGQRFIPESGPKIAQAAAYLREGGGAVHVDGGVNRDTAHEVGSYGPDILVVGSALFQRGHDAAQEVETVKARAAEGWRAAQGAARSRPGSVPGALSEVAR